MINVISNLPRGIRSGGVNARNAAAMDALGKVDDLFYVGPIDPPVALGSRIVSKALRLSGLAGDFAYYSPQRLAAIAEQVRIHCRPDADLDFYQGFTPWIMTKPARSYVAWNDCTFHDYVSIFHDRSQFREPDLQRIERLEASWLKRARQVIFRSQWAAKRAIGQYGLDAERVRSVPNFGEIGLPQRDLFSGGREFVFISTDFAAKGGYVVLNAFGTVREQFADASLIVIGDRPSRRTDERGVTFVGYLRKEDPAEVEQFRAILGRARALVHPTRSDISPATLVEAAYFGCPVIASRRFAIPEVVDDGCTGLLLDNPSQGSTVATAMIWMLEHEGRYARMRKATWSKARKHHTKEHFERCLAGCIQDVLG